MCWPNDTATLLVPLLGLGSEDLGARFVSPNILVKMLLSSLGPEETVLFISYPRVKAIMVSKGHLLGCAGQRHHGGIWC